MCRFDYGFAPLVQFNCHQTTSIQSSSWLKPDLRLIEKAIGVGFFDYGPALWMLGEIEPLKALQNSKTRAKVISRILTEYPLINLTQDQLFYRLRKAPEKPADFGEYDSPPITLAGSGRLDSKDLSVMYASQDLQICIHECRGAAEDDIFVASLAPTKTLRLLDLTAMLQEADVTAFESLDMAVHMLFLAGKHSYYISREITRAARTAGFDGLAYPSYFSLLRTGGMPVETAFGLPHRMISQFVDREKSKVLANLAIFGRPIERGTVSVRCINRLLLNRVEYGVHFGPVAN
jgi:hypothetical protein